MHAVWEEPLLLHVRKFVHSRHLDPSQEEKQQVFLTYKHNPFSVLVSQKTMAVMCAACSQQIYHSRRGTAVINKINNECIPLRWATSRLLIFSILAPCNDLVVHFMEAINTMSFTCAFPAHDKSLSAHENVYIRTQKCKPQKKKFRHVLPYKKAYK